MKLLVVRFVSRFFLFSCLYGALSCASADKWKSLAFLNGDDATEQRMRAVEIHVPCKHDALPLSGEKLGSGVIFSVDRVLTAKHVIECPPGFSLGQIFVVDVEQRKVNMTVYRTGFGDINYDGADTARLIVAKGYEGWDVKPLEFALEEELRVDDPVCVSTAIPKRWRRCGTVDGVIDRRIYSSYIADYGNSGSGVYDSDNRLVGILTRIVTCSNDQICGSIADRRYRWYDQKYVEEK